VVGVKDWQDYANCKNVPTDLFFASGSTRESSDAKEFCNSCPVRKFCLSAALKSEEGHSQSQRAGIWGGLTARERHLLWGKLVRQRTRKLCRRGHPLSGDNVYVVPSSGYLECRECRKHKRKKWESENKYRKSPLPIR